MIKRLFLAKPTNISELCEIKKYFIKINIGRVLNPADVGTAK